MYSLCAPYLGLLVLMNAAQEGAMAYTVLVILALPVLFLVIRLVAGSFMVGPIWYLGRARTWGGPGPGSTIPIPTS